jgi:2-polyprenyl-3-methyl-5-hydroxy-6-metoxy-1,4-benzoquinol methylase
MDIIECCPRDSSTGLEHLVALMQAKGTTLEPAEFQSKVNIIFHAFESEVYDQIHEDMKKSLPRQFMALTNDCLASAPVSESLTMLDIGCGTGLSTELFLSTELGSRVKHVDLLDTSPEMLNRCSKRPCLGRVPHRLLCGTLDVLSDTGKYDIILMCSVLHHIPDINGFLSDVVRLQKPGGLFFHFQDPNGDYLRDKELQQRIRQLNRHFSKRLPPWTKRFAPRRFAKGVWSKLSGRRHHSYIDGVNGKLLEGGIIAEPMTAQELWSVTDIHVYDEQGISIEQLKTHWKAYDLVSTRAYSFFGEMYSELPRSFRRREEQLHNLRASNGMHLCGAWRRNDN